MAFTKLVILKYKIKWCTAFTLPQDILQSFYYLLMKHVKEYEAVEQKISIFLSTPKLPEACMSMYLT